ncbi:hypothetical protein RUM43_006358 [Polyplax serrata]|uniref:Uncharacterized protein n=1 Tax=Polyplax serrata TaxID=468196 RepID=A0AAN8PEU3_POLSC
MLCLSLAAAAAAAAPAVGRRMRRLLEMLLFLLGAEAQDFSQFLPEFSPGLVASEERFVEGAKRFFVVATTSPTAGRKSSGKRDGCKKIPQARGEKDVESERQKPRGPWETMGKRFAVFLVKRAGAKGTERNDLSVKKATQMPVTFLLTNRPDIYELIFDLSPLKPARINWKIARANEGMMERNARAIKTEQLERIKK